jgi:hypothetical protein
MCATVRTTTAIRAAEAASAFLALDNTLGKSSRHPEVHAMFRSVPLNLTIDGIYIVVRAGKPDGAEFC